MLSLANELSKLFGQGPLEGIEVLIMLRDILSSEPSGSQQNKDLFTQLCQEYLSGDSLLTLKDLEALHESIEKGDKAFNKCYFEGMGKGAKALDKATPNLDALLIYALCEYAS